MAGFFEIVSRDTKTYQDLAENHLESIVKLADIDISNYIENSMTKPVMVSKTMANDEFLKSWLLQEKKNVGNAAYLKQLYNYLKAYQEKYDYTTVFCVSAQTGNYYYQDGLNKTISSGDKHDIWYYNFIASNKEYDLEIDTDQVNHNTITVFVNFRMESSDGSLLGVIGIGLQVSSIEDIIRPYENDYNLSVYIINAGGAENSYSGKTDIFVKKDDLPKLTGIHDNVRVSDSDEGGIQWFTSGNTRKCLITKYNDVLHWYLILEKDTSSISSKFQDRIKSNVVFMLISLAACILVTTAVFSIFNRRVIAIENTDELTGLPNRKMLIRQYPAFVRKYRNRKNTLFMLDVDHFKEINDTYGHVFGNEILAIVGNALKQTIDGYGIAARWGGDEFLGVLHVSTNEAKQILSRLMDVLKSEGKDSRHYVTISAGIVEINGLENTDQLINKADAALYSAKEHGRNRIELSYEDQTSETAT